MAVGFDGFADQGKRSEGVVFDKAPEIVGHVRAPAEADTDAAGELGMKLGDLVDVEAIGKDHEF